MASTAATGVAGTTASAYNAGGSASTEQTTSKNTLDMNAFLTMFMTQLKHQDPTNPLQSHELAAQLSQFTTVERLTQANDHLKNIEEHMASLSNAQMVSLIGKEVTGTTNMLRVHEGKVSEAGYALKTPAEVSVKITDALGNVVRKMPLGLQQPGNYEIKWDGKNEYGQQLAEGDYGCSIEAFDADGNPLAIPTSAQGTVHSFRVEQGIPYLILDSTEGIKITPGEITEVRAQGIL